ncbi:MAG: hypothetical protein ACPHN2_00200 [Sinimarinibacterium flocculans]|uniref:hypothetical protein n=1 Tax=Sinimarinibacterium flocculans TaxID=985250 RepID=UPI003C67DB74
MTESRTTVVINLPAHRRRALELVNEGLTAEQAYDKNIAGYIAFLKREGDDAGYAVQTHQDDQVSVFRIDERSHDEKKAAHAWLESLPDIWNWMPSA